MTHSHSLTQASTSETVHAFHRRTHAPERRARPRSLTMTNSYDVAHGLSQDAPGPLEPVEAAPISTVAQGDAQVPTGAIVNGRTLADRLEAYPFESEGGNLRLCSDWVEFRRCFEYLAEWASTSASAPAAGDALDAARYRSHRAALTSVNTAWLDNVAAALEAMGLDPDDADALPTAEQVDAAFDAAIAAQRKGNA